MNKSEKSYLLYLFISITLVVSIMTVSFYNLGRKEVNSQNHERYSGMLAQLSQSIDHMISIVGNIVYFFYSDTDVKEYAHYLKTREYVRILRIQERIGSMVNYNGFIDAIHVYYESDHTVLSYNRGLIDASLFLDQETLSLNADNYFFHANWSPPRMIPTDSYSESPVTLKLSLVYPLNPEYGENKVFLIIYIDWQYIHDMISKMGFSSENPLYYINPKGERFFLNMPEENRHGSDNIVLRHNSLYTGTLEVELSNTQIYQGLNSLILYTLIITLACMLVGFFLVYQGGRIFLNAFQSLSKLLGTDDFSLMVERASQLVLENQERNRYAQYHDLFLRIGNLQDALIALRDEEDWEGIRKMVLELEYWQGYQSKAMKQLIYTQCLSTLLTERTGFSEERKINYFVNLFRQKTDQDVQKLLSSIINDIKTHNAIRKDPAALLVERVKRYINSNLEGDLTIETISASVYMSRSHLSRLFSLKEGVSLKDFILEQRYRKAKSLLGRSRMHVKEVGRSVGYSNSQSFIRFFKGKEGLTPSAYRKLLCHNKQ